MPYPDKCHGDYGRDGLVVIGVHAPEFAFERNPDNVRKAVAAQVSQVDRLRAVGEDEARTLLLVERLGDAPGGAEALFGQGRVPDEAVVFGDQEVGVAVAVEIDELEVRVAQVSVHA